MKRFFFLITLCFWAFTGSRTALAADNGTRLFEIFNKALTPEESTMILTSQPRDSGRIPMMYLNVKKAVVAGMTVNDAQVMAYELMATPIDQWDSVPYPRILSMLDCSVTAQVTQEHIDTYMKGRTFSNGRWHNIKVTLHDGYFEASGKYLADLKIFKAVVGLSLKGQLEVRQGSQIWLKVLEFQVNSADVPLWIVEQALQRIQPILNLEKFVIPAKLGHIDISPQSVVFSTRRPPRLLEGLSWHFKRKKALP